MSDDKAQEFSPQGFPYPWGPDGFDNTGPLAKRAKWKTEKHIDKTIAEMGIEGIDAFFGESSKGRGHFVSDTQTEWGRVARELMDAMYAELRLPNNYKGDFWAAFEPQIAQKLKPKQIALLKDFYPNGPRYV